MGNTTSNYNLYLARTLTLIIILLSFILKSGNNELGKYVGILILFASLAILYLTFKSKKTRNEIKTNFNQKKLNKGIYSYVRYPIFLSNILFIIGITLISQNLLLVVLDYFNVKLIMEYIEENDKIILKKDSAVYAGIGDVPKLNILRSIYLNFKKRKLN